MADDHLKLKQLAASELDDDTKVNDRTSLLSGNQYNDGTDGYDSASKIRARR